MGTPRWVETVEQWWQAQPRPLTCHYCGAGPLERDLPNSNELRATIDHKIPRSKGGSGKLSKNGVVACRPCNLNKGVLMPEEWMAVIEYRRRTDALRASNKGEEK